MVVLLTRVTLHPHMPLYRRVKVRGVNVGWALASGDTVVVGGWAEAVPAVADVGGKTPTRAMAGAAGAEVHDGSLLTVGWRPRWRLRPQ